MPDRPTVSPSDRPSVSPSAPPSGGKKNGVKDPDEERRELLQRLDDPSTNPLLVDGIKARIEQLARHN